MKMDMRTIEFETYEEVTDVLEALEQWQEDHGTTPIVSEFANNLALMELAYK